MGWDEKELLEKAKAGGVESFEILIQAVRQKAYQIALSYLKNQEDAEDALQDSLLKIYRGLSRFQETSRFSTWVYRVVVNTCLDHIKKNKRQKDRILSFSGEDREENPFDAVSMLRDESAEPERHMLQKEKTQIILACLERIAPSLREVVVLRDVQGFSYGEIAQILDISEGTVKSRLSRARQAVKEMFFQIMGEKGEQK